MNDANDKVPFFKTWRGWYIFLIVVLALLIILFSLFTKTFS